MNITTHIFKNYISSLQIFELEDMLIFTSYEDAQQTFNDILNDTSNLPEQYSQQYKQYQKFDNYNTMDIQPFKNQDFINFIENKINIFFQGCTLSIYSTPFIKGYYYFRLLCLKAQEDKGQQVKLERNLKILIQSQPLKNYETLYEIIQTDQYKQPQQTPESIIKYIKYMTTFEQLNKIMLSKIQMMNQNQVIDQTLINSIIIEFYKIEYQYFNGDDDLGSRIQFLAYYLQKYFYKSDINAFMVLNRVTSNILATQQYIIRYTGENYQQYYKNMFNNYLTLQNVNNIDQLSNNDLIILSKAFQILKRQQLQQQLEFILYTKYMNMNQQDIKILLYLLNNFIQRNYAQPINNILDQILSTQWNSNQQYKLELIANQFIMSGTQINQNIVQQIINSCPYSITRKFIYNISEEQTQLYKQLQYLVFKQIYQSESQEGLQQIYNLFQKLNIQPQTLSLKSILSYPNDIFYVQQSNTQLYIPQSLYQFFQFEQLFIKLQLYNKQQTQLYHYIDKQQQQTTTEASMIKRLINQINKELQDQFWKVQKPDEIKTDNRDIEMELWLYLVTSDI